MVENSLQLSGRKKLSGFLLLKSLWNFSNTKQVMNTRRNLVVKKFSG